MVSDGSKAPTGKLAWRTATAAKRHGRGAGPPRVHGDERRDPKPHRSGLSNTASLNGTFTRNSFSIARQLPSGRDTQAGW